MRYVIAAAELGSFRRAAEALGIRESSISRRIRDLESRLGAGLFNRDAAGVKLTFAGEAFVRHARQLLRQMGAAEHEVAEAGRGAEGIVRIGLNSSIASGFITELVQAYGIEHVNVRLEFREGGLKDTIPAIQDHQLDIAFLVSPPQAVNCDVKELWNEAVYVALPEEDELARKEVLEWADIARRHFLVSLSSPDGPEVEAFLSGNFEALGHGLSIERHSVHRDTLMNLVACGRGITLTSEATIAATFPGVRYRLLAGETLPFCAVWAPNNDNPALRRFLSMAKDLSRRRLRGR